MTTISKGELKTLVKVKKYVMIIVTVHRVSSYI